MVAMHSVDCVDFPIGDWYFCNLKDYFLIYCNVVFCRIITVSKGSIAKVYYSKPILKIWMKLFLNRETILIKRNNVKKQKKSVIAHALSILPFRKSETCSMLGWQSLSSFLQSRSE